MNLARLPRRGVFLVLAVAVATWLLHLAGVFGLPSGAVYDWQVRLAPADREPQSGVLLVQAGHRDLETGGERWLALLDAIALHRPALIAFALLPGQASAAFYGRAAELGNVVIGRGCERDPEAADRLRVESLPAAASGYGVDAGVLALAPSEYGIHRRQSATVWVGTEAHPGLEAVAARRVGAAVPEDGFSVNFLSGPGSLPRVSLQRVLAGGLVPELVRGRVVLVGTTEAGALGGLYTPLSGADGPMPLLEFQGFALQTLLQGRFIREPGPWQTLLLLLLPPAAGVFLYQILGVRGAAWLTVAFTGAYAVLGWGLLALLRVRFPVVEMSAAQILAFAGVYGLRMGQDERTLRRMIVETGAKLRDRVIPPSFYASREHWAYVANLLNQTLELRRLIFLERVKQDHRVREVRALHCSLEDIDERRRDYLRTPYSTAVAEGGPIRLPRPYLRRQGDDPEDQYLVPLLFAGEVMGFWAFGIDPAKAAAVPSFLSMVADYASQISEMLYHRERWLEEQAAKSHGLRRYLAMEAWQVDYQSLSHAVRLLEKRLLSLENVFNGIGTATVLYDLFGRVVQVNARMQELTQGADLRIFDRMAVEVVSAISGVSLPQAREYLYYVVLDRAVITLPAPAVSDDERTYVLSVRPLMYRGEDTGETAEAHPFRLGGVLIELTDITLIDTLCRLKEHLVQRVGSQLRHDVDDIIVAAGQLRDPGLGGDRRREVARLLDERIAAAKGVLEETQRWLEVDIDVGTLECYPIDPRRPVVAALKGLEREARSRGVELALEVPDVLRLAMSEPVALERLVRSIVGLLIADATEGSRVQVAIDERELAVCFVFRNTGFGIPDERLQDYLFGAGEVTTEEFRRLRRSARQVQQWGGTLTAESTVGAGMRFEVRLKGFV